MAGGVELATGYVSLTVSTKGLGADIARQFSGVERQAQKTGAATGKQLHTSLRSSLTGLGQELSRTGSSIGRSLGTGIRGAAEKGIGGLKSVAGGGALALAGMATAGAAVGIKTAAGMEQAKIAFSTMLGSGKKADAFLKDLAAFAAKTPFEFPELQDAASSLISAGINAKDVIPIMTTLGDVTSGMGTGAEGVKRATIALQQMNAAGKISGEDLAQLRDAGIPVYDLLAKATGKSKAAVVDLANKGKLGKKELQQLMKALSGPEAQSGLGRFAGLMDKQSQSLSGLFSTLKDTLGQGLAGALGPAIPLIKSGLGALSNGLGTVFGYVAKNKAPLSEFFGVIGSSLKTFGTLTSAWLKPFIASLTKGQGTFKDFADFLGSHQKDITGGLIAGARFAIEFAGALGTVASVGLKAFAFLMDAQANMTDQMLAGFKLVLHGSALAFGWIPGVGDKLKAADDKFNGFATNFIGGMHKAAAGARSLADGIDTKMKPALDAAKKGLDKAADQERLQAASRDSANAISLIGTKANGNQIHLKRFADISKLGATEQKGLRDRIDGARTALHDQLGAMSKAGAGQESLTAAWVKGKKRLYDEFVQMGLSKKEAGRLADKYAGIKPKVSTKFEQPGMKTAKDNADTLKSKYDKLPKYLTTKISFDTFVDGHNAELTFKYGKGAVKMAAKDGAVLPGYTPGRDVHEFYSPTGGRLSLSGGEAVMVPEWTKAIGGPAEVARMNKAARKGQRFASGGVLGNVISAGGRAVEELGAKAIGALLKKYSSDGLIGGKGFAAALNYVKAHAGHPYQFATIWDCSGLMGSVESIIQGRSPNQRRWSTPAFAGGPLHAQGFTRNKRSAFMIGVNPSPGRLGHTAGTLNGVNIESAGGVGVRYGRSARGWNNPMFPLHYGFADGGVIPKPKDGDLPFDTLSRRGQRYDEATKKLVEALYGKQAGVYDQGGRLDPGQVAINMSRKPETVLTGAQMKALTKAAERPARHTTIQVDATGAGSEEIAAKIARKQREHDALHPIWT